MSKFIQHFSLLCLGLMLGVAPSLSQSLSQGVAQTSSSSSLTKISQSEKTDKTERLGEDNQKIVEEMITPVAIAGTPSAPFLVSQDRAKQAAQRLYLAVQTVLDTDDTKLSFLQVNNAFEAYNNMIVLLGLTESAQIDNFPRLKSIGLALTSLRERITVVKR
jgi:hypothetical protein